MKQSIDKNPANPSSTVIDRHGLPIPKVMTTQRGIQQIPSHAQSNRVTRLPHPSKGEGGGWMTEANGLQTLCGLINPTWTYLKSEWKYSLIDGYLYSDREMILTEIRRHRYPYEKFLDETHGLVAFFPAHKLLNIISACHFYGTDVLIMHVWEEEPGRGQQTVAVHSARALFAAWWDSWFKTNRRPPKELFDLGSSPPEGVVWRPFHPDPRLKDEPDVVHYDPLAAYWVSVWKGTRGNLQLVQGSPEIDKLRPIIHPPNEENNDQNMVDCQRALGIPKDQLWPYVADPSRKPVVADVRQLLSFAKPTKSKRQFPLGLYWDNGVVYNGTHPTLEITDIQSTRAYMRKLGTLPPYLGNGEDDPVVYQSQWPLSEAA